MPTDYRATGISPPMHRVFMTRHRKAVKVAFLDGHAKAIPLANLWHLHGPRSSSGRPSSVADPV
jgi:prepilin-type processing-associated H-X9-DG protein